MRLNRYLAAAGLGSRRACETIITAGRVSINGRTCRELATTVAPGDSVKVDNRTVTAQETYYLLINKPVGYISSASDELGRQTVFDLLPPGLPRLFHVGRLDRDSEGLLLLTNDGALAQKLTHPSHEVDKDYEVALNKEYNPADTARMLKGIYIPVEQVGVPAVPAGPERSRAGAMSRASATPRPAATPSGRAPATAAAAAAVKHVRARAVSVTSLGSRKVKITLRQGLKRQVRLMLYELGYEVEMLRRVRLGPLTLGRLLPGRWRELTPREVTALTSLDRPRSA